MSKQQIRFYSVKRNGRGFWQPTAAMKLQGFASIPCGLDGPDAWAIAEAWTTRWDATRRGEAPSPAKLVSENLSPDELEALTIYPPRSLGRAFQEFRATEEWKKKPPRTREDWFRGWKRIKPIFGDCDPRTVKLNAISAWRQAIQETVSLQEAHRSMKIWRALWQKAAALKYCSRDEDPSFGVHNTAPKGRSESWAEGHVARMCKRAWRMGFYGLTALMATAWDTQLSPGDARELRANQFCRDAEGTAFFGDRAKTGTPVGGVLSDRALRVHEAYFEKLGVELHGDAQIYRNRSGAPYSSDTLGDDFRDVREAEFGKLDKRQLRDFRRSGAGEAIAGKAQPATWHTRWPILSPPPMRCSQSIAR